MNPINPIIQFFQNLLKPITNPLNQFLNSSSVYRADYRNPSSTPSPTSMPIPLADQIRAGFAAYGKGKDVPMATTSAQLAQLGNRLPHPFLPAALSLKESSGLLPSDNPDRQRMREYANPIGVKVGGQLIRYPSPQIAISGGGNWGPGGNPQQGLAGTLLNSGYYKDYLNSGNLEDFIRPYTPPGGPNDSLQGQMKMLLELLSYFGPEATRSAQQRR